jgi:hypothetical protein
MNSNLDRYKKDLESLINRGDRLYNAIQLECFPEEFKKEVKKQLGDKAKDILESTPSFKSSYQAWYSEAKVLVKQLLPDRLSLTSRSGALCSIWQTSVICVTTAKSQSLLPNRLMTLSLV